MEWTSLSLGCTFLLEELELKMDDEMSAEVWTLQPNPISSWKCQKVDFLDADSRLVVTSSDERKSKSEDNLSFSFMISLDETSYLTAS